MKNRLRDEIDRRRQEVVIDLVGHEENFEYYRLKGMHDAFVDLLSFIESLPEESSCKRLIDKADLLRWLREMYNRAERLQADIHIEIAAKAAVVATLKNVIEYIEQR